MSADLNRGGTADGAGVNSDPGGDKKKKAAAVSTTAPAVMPAVVRPGQVMGLVEITGGLGLRIDTSKLADEMGADIAVFLPILEAAEMLGLVRSENGLVYLTDDGVRFQETTREKIKLLSDKLAKIEPFHTALGCVAKKGSITTREVAEKLASKGIVFSYKPEMNEELIQSALIHWTTTAGLLKFNGKTGRFQKA